MPTVDWPTLISRLVSRDDLARDESRDALLEILSGDTSEVFVAAFLAALTTKGETVEELVGFVDALMAEAVTFSVDVDAIDIVGTGGDRLRSVNVSTMSSLAVAACGVPVAKHGNRAASSSVGTADVLEHLGVKIDVGPDIVARCVREVGMGFCFAQRFHPGLRHLGPVRRQLGFRTAFNVLGPLANPAGVTRLLLGVANGSVMTKMADVLQARGVTRAFLVHADDGLDELSLGAPATVLDVTPDAVTTWRFDPREILGRSWSVDDIRGGDADVNATAVRDFVAARPGAVFDTVCANAGLALMVAGKASTLDEGFEMAATAVSDGGAARVLEGVVAVSNS